jgi:hypothetical protein
MAVGSPGNSEIPGCFWLCVCILAPVAVAGAEAIVIGIGEMTRWATFLGPPLVYIAVLITLARVFALYRRSNDYSALSGCANVIRQAPFQPVTLTALAAILVIIIVGLAAMIGLTCRSLDGHLGMAFNRSVPRAVSWIQFGIDVEVASLPFLDDAQEMGLGLSAITPLSLPAKKCVSFLKWLITANILWVVWCVYRVVRTVVTTRRGSVAVVE